jgi:hypothetical protein
MRRRHQICLPGKEPLIRVGGNACLPGLRIVHAELVLAGGAGHVVSIQRSSIPSSIMGPRKPFA